MLVLGRASIPEFRVTSDQYKSSHNLENVDVKVKPTPLVPC